MTGELMDLLGCLMSGHGLMIRDLGILNRYLPCDNVLLRVDLLSLRKIRRFPWQTNV